MAISSVEVLHFLSAYGYLLILPLSIIEGPIVTMLAGLLLASGHLDWRIVLSIVVLGDLIGDALHYALGRWSWKPLINLSRWYGLTETKAAKLERSVKQNATRLLLLGKWTHAIGGFVLIAAGMARVPLAWFLLVNLLATLPKTVVLLLLGYYAGQHLPAISDWLLYAPLVLLPIGAAMVALFVRRARAFAGPAKS